MYIYSKDFIKKKAIVQKKIKLKMNIMKAEGLNILN